MLIRLGVTGLKKTRVVYLSDLLEGRGQKGQFDLVCVCEGSLDDWAHGGYFHDLFTCDVCGFRFLSSRSYSKEWVWYLGIKIYVILLQGNEMSTEWHFRNLILGICCCIKVTLIVYMWSSG